MSKNEVESIEKKMKKTHKSQMNAKDELEYATNWRRAFNQIFTHLKWLNAFAKINYIAAYKILKKGMKTFFQVKDNIIDKKIKSIIENMTFTKRQGVLELIEKVVKFFSKHFTDHDRKRAMRALEDNHVKLRKKDSFLMAWFGSMSFTFLLMAFFFLAIPTSDGDWDWDNVFASFPAF